MRYNLDLQAIKMVKLTEEEKIIKVKTAKEFLEALPKLKKDEAIFWDETMTRLVKKTIDKE